MIENGFAKDFFLKNNVGRLHDISDGLEQTCEAWLVSKG